MKLKENMCHLRYPKYGSLRSRLRVGNQTCNDLLTLKTRFIDRNGPLSRINEELAKVQGGNVKVPVVCQGNNSRHSINWLSTEELSSATGKQFAPILCPAVFNAVTRGKNQQNLR